MSNDNLLAAAECLKSAGKHLLLAIHHDVEDNFTGMAIFELFEIVGPVYAQVCLLQEAIEKIKNGGLH